MKRGSNQTPLAIEKASLRPPKNPPPPPTVLVGENDHDNFGRGCGCRYNSGETIVTIRIVAFRECLGNKLYFQISNWIYDHDAAFEIFERHGRINEKGEFDSRASWFSKLNRTKEPWAQEFKQILRRSTHEAK